jgi:acetolactate synthase I/III small subunit
MLHTFAVYVDNKPGVLNRVSSLFRRRAFNIESLTVGHTETPGISRMTVVVDTDEYGARRLEAHLYKLVPCRRVDNITTSPSISRDLALIKVAATGEARTHVLQLVDVYRARIVDVSPESLVLETTGTEDKIDSLVEVLRPYGVVEMVRTGRVAMARGITPERRIAPRIPPASTAAADISGDVSNCSV